MSASRERLGVLHELLTEAFMRRLEVKELTDDDGNVTRMDFASSADLNAISNFLKQNQISADPEQDANLKKLDEMFEARRKNKARPSADEIADEYTKQDSQNYH